MKITKIEMENLNSLKGYWCIDFTHPDYETYHNLFVISGDTGAGKTTILDAITLALYGKTPRQDKISKTENELMTRHTGYCMARVTYKCKKGTYVSEFNQKRANDRATGALQKPQCKITCLEDGTENNEIPVTKLEEETVKIIQLDYEQFCRSMMLAQGQFDTFIKGDERERAAILSKLNGTEQYKKIGNRIWLKAAAYEKKCKDEKKNLDDIVLLSEEDIKNLNNEIKEKNDSNEKIKNELENIGQALVWLNELENCQNEYNNADANRKAYEDENKEFTEKSANLAKAEKAGKCDVAYNALKIVIQNIEDKENENKNKSEDLKTVKADFESAEKSWKEKTDAEKTAEENKNKDSEIWKKVRGFDSKLKPLSENLDNAKKLRDDGKTKLDEANKNLENYKENISKLTGEIEELKNYLDEHKQDKNLEKVTAVLEQKKNQILKAVKDVNLKAEAIASNIKSSEEKKAEFEEETKKLGELKEQLKNLVSTEFVSISLLLRAQLEKGKACPVCGSTAHPSCEGDGNAAKVDEKSQKVAVDVAGLNKKLETAEKKVAEITNELKNLSDENARIDSEKAELESSLKTDIAEVNKQIKGWNFTLSADDTENLEDDFEKIITELNKLCETYESKNNKKSEKENDLNSYIAKKDAIKIDELAEAAANSENNFNKAQTEFDNVNNERKALFGEKNPDEEEKLANKNIEDLKNQLADAEKKKNDLKSKKEGIETTISNNNEDIKKYNTAKAEKQKLFEEVLSKNGFASEKEFLESRMSETEISELKETEENLKTRDVETLTAFNSAKNNLKNKLKNKATDLSKEELEQKKTEQETEQTNNLKRIGEITNQLERNEDENKKAEAQKLVYEEAKKNYDLWSEMQTFIGVKSGEDFEVFVEALAFKKLLSIATKYVEAITGKYSLVQVENKVDFLVHDTHYPDNKDDRPVSNMSGGEKFIISLSLALGISELASQNVKVESLFLDEGFGTLSGKYLIEAINALKSLQASGKMLGIITHIETVINAFDLKIEAEKTLAGTSVLKGPGVENKAS